MHHIYVRRFKQALAATLITVAVVACATNPVTGERDFVLVNSSWDSEVGTRQYLPLRQMQGGDYTADPEVEAYVREVGIKLARVSDARLPYEFHVINSSVPNAWALPSGKISINRGLLTKMNSEAELAAVLGHEIIHAASRHGAQSVSRGMVVQVGVVAATVVGAQKGYGELAQFGAGIGGQLITTKNGRDAESEADLFGMEYMKRAGYDLQGAVDLQRTFLQLSQSRQQDWLSGLFATHPPSQARVDANIATAKRLGPGGFVGRERYQQVMSRLKQTEPAYEQFEAAQAAFKEGNTAEASRLVNQAIQIEPKDGHFYSLLGDVASEQRQWNTAKRNYDKAIQLNDELFYYYLQRGKVFQSNNNFAAAKADFERSLKLLPTEDAQAGLGDVANATGDEASAIQYYTSAAQGNGEAAKYANTKLADLQFADAPGKFLRLAHGKGNDGNLVVQLSNTTTRPIDSIVLEYRFGSATSGQRSRIDGSVAAGKKRTINTGTRLSDTQLNALKVYVVQARMVGK